jgi:hypothetical protein
MFKLDSELESAVGACVDETIKYMDIAYMEYTVDYSPIRNELINHFLYCIIYDKIKDRSFSIKRIGGLLSIIEDQFFKYTEEGFKRFSASFFLTFQKKLEAFELSRFKYDPITITMIDFNKSLNNDNYELS